ncbi:MAG: hypothetical protein P1V51_08610 [Deltaproteobacteria bacterium]|nr:hypothetical protein [Deltaproteobacteria bacterium]
MVLEADLRRTHQDFATLAEARTYADDAASETDDDPPLAYVFDADFELVHEGRPYHQG